MINFGMTNLTLIDDLEKKAMMVLRYGRVFYEETNLGEWIGFRLGKVEISVRMWASFEMKDACWVPRLITKIDSWKLPDDWQLRILRDACNALSEKIRCKFMDELLGKIDKRKDLGKFVDKVI